MTKQKGNLKFERVRKVEFVGKKQTYDFSIPETECFFANNILVHNSGSLEQTADKVIFVFKAIDNEDNVRYFINLAKNRQGKTIKKEVVFEGEHYRFKDMNDIRIVREIVNTFKKEER